MVEAPDHDSLERGDAKERTERDLKRLSRRQPGHRFFHAVALIGSVGWPIVLLATGGALFGRWLDQQWHTGIHFAGGLLTLGAALGTYVAFRALRGGS